MLAPTVRAYDVWLGLMALSLSLGLRYLCFVLLDIPVDYEKLYRKNKLQERQKKKGVSRILPIRFSYGIYTV